MPRCCLPLAVLLVTWLCADACRAEAETGELKPTFTRNAVSVYDIYRRFDQRVRRQDAVEYDVAQESFDAWVPESYAKDAGRYGVLVWMSGGQPRDEWKPILEKHRLLWVAPNDATGSRDPYHCYGLALDAVANLADRYRVDKRRLYVGGERTGGAYAVRLAIAFSDVFAGAVTLGGLDFYRRIINADSAGRYGGAYPKPINSALARARNHRRFVVFVRDGAAETPYVVSVLESGFNEVGFKHVRRIDVPSLSLTPEQFDAGLTALR